ncbi:MAG: HD domain-containing protein [Treponema sp.]|nr:HD domain-containing protein [Treponema sp.]
MAKKKAKKVSRAAKKTVKTSDFNFAAVNDEFDMDSLNNWTTTIGLVKSIIALVERRIDGCETRVFFHAPEFHEYRELDKEGIITVSDDSLFAGFLAMESGVIPLEKMFNAYKLSDPMLGEMLRDLYGCRYIMPVVHGFEMVAFLIFCSKNPARRLTIKREDLQFLQKLSVRLQINLYAASITTRGQRHLLNLKKYPFILQQRKSISEVNNNLFDDLKQEINFYRGVAYRYDEKTNVLYPFAFCNIDKNKVPTLRAGEGISGQVFKNWASVFVPDRSSHPAYSLMKEEQFLQGSIVSVPLGTEQKRIGVMTITRSKQSKDPFSLEHQYMMEIASAFFASEIINRNLRDEVEESNLSVVKSLTNALEAKDLYTEGHSDRVAIYSVGIAKRMGYSEERIHMLRYGAQLHDIGKIGISDAIINKPEKLNDAEREIIKRHAEIGYRILCANPYFEKIKNFVRYHHEHLDGTGYYGKKKGEYPEESEIISCADVYDALTSDRPYRKALSRQKSLEILSKDIGRKFSKKIYDSMVAFVESEDLN